MERELDSDEIEAGKQTVGSLVDEYEVLFD